MHKTIVFIFATLIVGITASQGSVASKLAGMTRNEKKLSPILNPERISFQNVLSSAPDTLSMSVEQNFDSTLGQWVDAARTRYYYDANVRLVMDVTETFDGTNWNNDSLNSYTYNAGGLLIQDLVQRWSLASGWTDNVRFTHVYDANGNDIETVLQTYWQNIWSNQSRTTTTYDANGNELMALNQMWGTSAWVDVTRITSVFSNITRTLTKTTQWSNAGVWENSDRSVYYYGQTYLDSIVDQTWIGTIWSSTKKLVYRIRTPGLVLNVTVLEMGAGVWDKYLYLVVTYQGNRQTQILYELWDGLAYAPTFRILNTFALPQPVALERTKGRSKISKGFLSGGDSRILYQRPNRTGIVSYDILGKSAPTFLK